MQDGDRRSDVGIVGLGAMGAPMARHLLAAGHDVLCTDLDDDRVRTVVEGGGRAASGITDVARSCAVILVLVPSDDDVITVGREILDAGQPNGVVVICSSVRPETCHRLGELAEQRSMAVIDAALTGGVRAAEAGTMHLMVGGREEDLARARQVLTAFSSAVRHLGPLGAGQVGKTVNNLLHWIQIAGVVEALELGERLGVPAPRMREALTSGSTDSQTLHDLEYMRLTWHAKDLANALQMAREAERDLPVAEHVRDVMPTITVERIAQLLRIRNVTVQ